MPSGGVPIEISDFNLGNSQFQLECTLSPELFLTPSPTEGHQKHHGENVLEEPEKQWLFPDILKHGPTQKTKGRKKKTGRGG